jgi:hypothetical protein
LREKKRREGGKFMKPALPHAALFKMIANYAVYIQHFIGKENHENSNCFSNISYTTLVVALRK